MPLEIPVLASVLPVFGLVFAPAPVVGAPAAPPPDEDVPEPVVPADNAAPPVPAPAPAPPGPPACACAKPIDAPASSAQMAIEKIVFRMFQLRLTLWLSSEVACERS